MIVDFKGLNLGDDGDYIVDEINGWEGRPEVVNGSVPRPRHNGSVRGALLAHKRVITLDLTIPLDPATGSTTLPKQKLREVMGIDDEETELRVGLDYGSAPEIVWARVTSFDIPTQKGYGRQQRAFIEWTATDPRRYSETPYVAETGLKTRPSGQTYPMTGTFAYAGAPGKPGAFQALNAGNAETMPLFTIRGPISNPSIFIQDDKGRRVIRFELTLAASETLTVNTSTGAVFIGKDTDRFDKARGALVEDMYLRPGVSTVGLTGSSTANPLLKMVWRDANL